MGKLEIKETEDSMGKFEPAGTDDSILVGMMFEKITVLFPEWKMGDRTDLAMALFSTVKEWAHDLELTSKSHRKVELDPTTLEVDEDKLII